MSPRKVKERSEYQIHRDHQENGHHHRFTFTSYLRSSLDALHLRDISTGLIKSLMFGMTITAVGCHEGFSTGAGAEEVGRSTTAAVVMSIFLVIAVDLIFTALFYFTGAH